MSNYTNLEEGLENDTANEAPRDTSLDEEFDKGAPEPPKEGEEKDPVELAYRKETLDAIAKAPELVKKAEDEERAKFEAVKHGMDAAGDRLVEKGMAKKNAVDGSLDYFSKYYDGSAAVSAGKQKADKTANVIKPGELEVKDGYSRSAVMNGIADRVRAEQAADLEADKKRFTKTESTKVGDECRSVYGSKVKYTDKDGKVTRWASIDADGNETPIDSPDSMKMQNAMNTGITSRGLSLAGKSWDDVFKAKDNEEFKKSMAYANEIANLNRMSQKEKLKRKGRFDLAVGDQMTAGLNDLDGKLKQAKEYMAETRRTEAIGGTAEEPPPFIKTEKDGSQYVYGYVAGEAVNRGNERLAQRGSKNSLSGLVVKQRIDNYGNPIDEPTLVVRMNIGGNVGKSKGTKDYPFSMSQVADIISNAYQNVNGVSQEEARRRTLERLGGRNPNAWVLPKTQDDVFKQNQTLKQMEIDAKTKADSRDRTAAAVMKSVSDMFTNLVGNDPAAREKALQGDFFNKWLDSAIGTALKHFSPKEGAATGGSGESVGGATGGPVTVPTNASIRDQVKAVQSQGSTQSRRGTVKTLKTPTGNSGSVSTPPPATTTTQAGAASDGQGGEDKPAPKIDVDKMSTEDAEKALNERQSSLEREFESLGGRINEDGKYVIDKNSEIFVKSLRSGKMKREEKLEFDTPEEAIEAQKAANKAQTDYEKAHAKRREELMREAQKSGKNRDERARYVSAMLDKFDAEYGINPADVRNKRPVVEQKPRQKDLRAPISNPLM